MVHGGVAVMKTCRTALDIDNWLPEQYADKCIHGFEDADNIQRVDVVYCAKGCDPRIPQSIRKI